MHLNSKISLTIIPMITIPLLLVGIYSYYLLWHKNTDISHNQLEYYVNHLQEHYNEKISEATVTLKILAEDSLLQQYLLTENQTDRYMLMYKPLLKRLTNSQRTNPALREISLLLPNGYEEFRISNRNAINYTENESDSEFFKIMLRGNASLYHFLGNNPDTGKNAFFISVPLIFRSHTQDTFTTTPKIRGYLTATLDPDNILYQNIPSPWDKGTTLLTEGNKIYRLSGQLPKATPDLAEQLNDLPVTRWITTSIQDQKVQHFSAALGPELLFHAYIPETVLLSSSLNINSFILALATFMLAVSIPLMLCLFRRHVLTPINVVNSALCQVNNGEPIPNIPPTTTTELNELINAFNNLNDRLDSSNQKIHNLAYIDTLTGLPNRTLFQRNLMRAIQFADHQNEVLALLYIDLDNFKSINDNMSHSTGDQLLQVIANILRELLRTEDMATRIEYHSENEAEEINNCSRLGGDEFTILLPHLHAPYQAGMIAERIRDAINRPIPINEHTVYITASIGIALWSSDTKDAEELIVFADQAMSQAKNSGKNKYCYFSPAISKQTKERAQIEQRLYKAMEGEKFDLYYQPIVDSLDLKIQSYEALIRWNDEELGSIPPDKFIHIAEENGLITRIGSWVITNVCAQVHQWLEAGYKDFKVGINLSALQVNNVDIVKEIEASIRHYNIPYHAIYVELTESSVIQGDQKAISNLRKLRDIGIQVALDDFGTGYSSLGYLRALPIDILKIDHSFIKDIHEGNNSIILSAIVTMAHALHMKVIVEGIEEQEQLKYLPQTNNVMIQGYLFSRPKPADEAISLLKNQRDLQNKMFEQNKK